MAIGMVGENEPLDVNMWHDAVKAEILSKMRNAGSVTVSGLYDELVYRHTGYGPSRIRERFGRRLSEQNVKEALMEMYMAEWIDIAGYHCDDCERYFSKNKMVAFAHATRIRLTEKGREKLPRHSFS